MVGRKVTDQENIRLAASEETHNIGSAIFHESEE